MLNYWGITSEVLTKEALGLGLDVKIISRNHNLFLVTGKGKEILFKSIDFGGNSAFGYKCCDNKELTNRVLEHYNIPVPKSVYLYKKEFEKKEYDFSGFSYPVVIKPLTESGGIGVRMGISGEQELLEKLSQEYQKYSKMIIQEEVKGNEYRLFCIFGEVILGYQRKQPEIIGDGVSSIGNLIDKENAQNSLRGDKYNSPLSYIKVDYELYDFILKNSGYTLNDVLKDGEILQLRGNSNIGTGGTIVNVTHCIHPDNLSLCHQISDIFGLQIAGIDFMSRDISKSYKENGGCIIEVNATPGIGGHIELTGIHTGKILLEKLFGF